MAEKVDLAKELFRAKGAEKVYSGVVSKLKKHVGAGQAVVDPKQTCVHITAGKGASAYAGLHPRKKAVLLNIRLEAPINSPRIRKVEQISRNRYNCEMLLTSPGDVDDEVLGWLEAGWKLASQKRTS